MAQDTDSNFLVLAAWWAGAGFFGLSIALMALMLWLRSSAYSLKKRSEIVTQEWERVLHQGATGFTSKPLNFWEFSNKGPRRQKKASWKKKKPDCAQNRRIDLTKTLIDQDLPHFLFYWNYLQESLRGDAQNNLNGLAASLDLETRTAALLKKSKLPKKLLAMNTLGNLRSGNSWNDLEKIAKSPDSTISAWALRALFRINPERSIRSLLPMIHTREDWSPVIIAKALKEIGADDLSGPLVSLVRQNYENGLKDRQMARLISYFSLAHASEYEPLLNRIFTETSNQETIIACLRLLSSEKMLPRVRELFKDERWQVRVQVVLTLGRFGADEDIHLLVTGLNDLEWWVRYRSAGALAGMPGVTDGMLEDLAESHPNEFSRDIIKHVLAEMKLQCLFKPSSNNLSR